MSYSLTAGTLNYEIPFPQPFILKRGFPLIIKENDDGWLIECPAFDEYGYGKTYQQALNDLGTSLFDSWKSIARLIQRKKKLGDELVREFNYLDENIIPD